MERGEREEQGGEGEGQRSEEGEEQQEGEGGEERSEEGRDPGGVPLFDEQGDGLGVALGTPLPCDTDIDTDTDTSPVTPPGAGQQPARHRAMSSPGLDGQEDGHAAVVSPVRQIHQAPVVAGDEGIHWYGSATGEVYEIIYVLDVERDAMGRVGVWD